MWPCHIEPAHRISPAFERCALWQGYFLPETLVIAFCRTAADDHEFVIGEACYRKVARNPAVHTDQRRQARTAYRLGHVVGKDSIKPFRRIRPSNEVFCEVGNINDTSSLAKHLRLLPHRFKPVLTGETVGICYPRRIGKPKRMFPAIVQAKDCTHCLLHLIDGPCAHGSPCCAFLVGEMDCKAFGVLVADPRFGELRIRPRAETGDIPREHVVLAFAINDPLRGHQAHAA